MNNKFEFKIINQKQNYESDPCAHGAIYLRVGETVITNEEDGDWGITAAALGVLYSIQNNHLDDDYSVSALIPHGCACLSLVSCPITISWKVHHRGSNVFLYDFTKCLTVKEEDKIAYKNLSIELSLKEYTNIVYKFAVEAKEYYKDFQPFVCEDGSIDEEYIEFWDVLNQLLDYAKQIIMNK